MMYTCVTYMIRTTILCSELHVQPDFILHMASVHVPFPLLYSIASWPVTLVWLHAGACQYMTKEIVGNYSHKFFFLQMTENKD